ncbi:lactonase family protein [Amycolatopsis sp. NPDC051903]|uniref:lactonase family protein n=1 Tax=Amycolatopsis sp. NPDC051903 TaxID=3363936 RepID=UPI0037873F3E
MNKSSSRRIVRTAVAAAALVPLAAVFSGATASAAPAWGVPGAVFVGTNHNNSGDPSQPGNQIAYYHRGADGTLTLIGSFATGGEGSGPGQRFAGDGLGSGNSVRVTTDRRFLLVTNAGSDTLSVLRILPDRLQVVDVVPTGDGSASQRFPNSVTQHGNTVYVLNAAGQGSITGFRLGLTGKLTPIPGSTRQLQANQDRFAPDALKDPTQISFSPDGHHLLVSIKDGPTNDVIPGANPTGPGRVLTFGVDLAGRPSKDFVRTDFANRGPFGFSFDNRGNVDLAEFVGGGVEDGHPTGAAGSYRIGRDGHLTPISTAVADHQIDTCWVVNNGEYAFGSNYTSGTISSWKVNRDGSLTLLHEVAGTIDKPGSTQGSTPLDLGLSPDGKNLYDVLPGSGKVAAWRIGTDGELTKVGEFGGLPQTPDGDHAPADFSALGSPAGIDVS